MHQLENLTYEFGPYRLNLAQRNLTRNGETIALTPKATDILVRLVTNAGHLVEKDDLLREVWPETFVEESNLTQNIFILRRALGDERADPKYIETVARRGYRFIANVKVYESDDDGGVGETEEAWASGAEGDAPLERVVVAVIPFINVTGDEGLEYLAEGLTDNIINNLSRVSRLRVMSRSAVFRYSADEVDPRMVGKELSAKAVLVGKIQLRPALAAVSRATGTGVDMADGAVGREVEIAGQARAIVITAELVEVATGWQLWGESFDLASADLLQIQDAITRQLLANLKLKLTGEEEKHVTARYTENPGAYQAYLEGRYHWSRYTRAGIEKAIGHFREAIEQDPNYALAYAAIVDCYLRLATNYLPPKNSLIAEYEISDPIESAPTVLLELERKVKLRFEWDWKSAERELRRASELKVSYPAAHQWYAAYHYAQELHDSQPFLIKPKRSALDRSTLSPLSQLASLQLTRNEQVQVFCGVAREQIEAGNYDAACRILQSFWLFGNWPELSGLNQESAADLLFTAGELAGCVASAKQVPKGQKYGEALLSGSIAIFEQISCRRCAAEARIELALCYYRQGLFALGRSTLEKVLDTLAPDDSELRSLALIRLASLERHAGRVQNALSYLNEATRLVEAAGPWVSGRCQLELASTYKDLALLEESALHFENAKKFSLSALDQFEAVGNHRLTAIVENNLGFLFSLIGEFSNAELYLRKARQTFTHFSDRIRCAQVDDSLARLYLAQQRLPEAKAAIEQSIQTIEPGDEDAILAESLTTAGRIYCALHRYYEARNAFSSAYHLTWRCGDIEGACRAISLIVEEMSEMLEPEERRRMRMRLVELLSTSQEPTTKSRLMRCLQMIDSASEF